MVEWYLVRGKSRLELTPEQALLDIMSWHGPATVYIQMFSPTELPLNIISNLQLFMILLFSHSFSNVLCITILPW